MAPAGALLVDAAGYVGFDLAKQLVAAKISFLLRMSSSAMLYTLEQVG